MDYKKMIYTHHTTKITNIIHQMRLAIVGSRTYDNYTEFKEIIIKNFTIEDITQIVSGGAKGADSLADKFAKEYNIPIINYLPDWNAFGKAAGIIRNTEIVNECTHLIAFPSHKGSGTQDSIKKAQKANKIVVIHWID